MIIIIPTTKYGSTYYNTFTMGVCNKYHGYFFSALWFAVKMQQQFVKIFWDT